MNRVVECVGWSQLGAAYANGGARHQPAERRPSAGKTLLGHFGCATRESADELIAAVANDNVIAT
jgi:hypothetical protein